MRDAGASLMDDERFKPHILEPLDVFGVDAFEPTRLVVKARMKTVPQKQWLVGRELRRRIVRRFAERGLDMAVPQVTVRTGPDKPVDGSS